ncbi:MAG: hypothetical protein RL173_2203 [Fibrobacterota bacterium]|jgi:hypothetical protein
MTFQELTYWAITLKVGGTLAAVAVLFAVLTAKRKMDRKRQERIHTRILDSIGMRP